MSSQQARETGALKNRAPTGLQRLSRISKDAIGYGRGRAKEAGKGQLIIHKRDGTIQTEYTYIKDPYPPKG